MRERAVRRFAGLLRSRLPEVGLEEVPDPRAREGRWSLAQILTAALVGLMAGCRSLSETEVLTEGLAPAMRRRLGLPRRLADTTARDALCRVPLEGLRAALHRLGYVVPVLGIIHWWMSVKADVAEPILYSLIFALLLGWRATRFPRRTR